MLTFYVMMHRPQCPPNRNMMAQNLHSVKFSMLLLHQGAGHGMGVNFSPIVKELKGLFVTLALSLAAPYASGGFFRVFSYPYVF